MRARPSVPTLAAVGLLLLGAGALAPLAAASHDGTGFGSKVDHGEPDLLRTMQLLPASQQPFVCQVNLGEASTIIDDGFYLAWRESAPGQSQGPNVFDLRLRAAEGEAAGTVVLDTDTTELEASFAQACFQAPAWGIVDANSNGFYDGADWVILDTGDPANLANAPAGTGPGFTPGDLRLTDTIGDLEAGTLVLAGDSDVAAYEAPFFSETHFEAGDDPVRLHDGDNSDTFNGGDDGIYLTMTDRPRTSNGLTAALDIRLFSELGPYGSRTTLVDADHIPRLEPLPPDQQPFVCQVELGITNDAADDAFYLTWRESAPDAKQGPRTLDLRLVDPISNTPGTFVLDEDTAEKERLFAGPCFSPPAWLEIDLDSNARWHQGDALVLDTGPASNIVGAPADTGPGFTPGDIRIMASAFGYTAGTLVRDGDDDEAAWGAASSTGPGFPQLRLRFYEPEHADTVSPDDELYVTASRNGHGPSPADIRLVSTYGAFGSMVLSPTPDLEPRVQPLDGRATPSLCQLDGQDPSSSSDDRFYLALRPASSSPPKAGETLRVHDVRLVPSSDDAPGTTITDTDEAELTAPILHDCLSFAGPGAQADAGSFAFLSIDVDSTGHAEHADKLVLDTGPPSNLDQPPSGAGVGFTAGDIRLTQDGSSPGPGTLVQHGDTDLSIWAGAETTPGTQPGFPSMELGWHDGDNSASWDAPYDRLYVSAVPPTLTEGYLEPADVRLVAPGGFPTDGGGGGSDPGDEEDTSEPGDRDGDGILDEDDNCPGTPNEGQEDRDGDGVGDACDDHPDADGDGIRDGDDNCPSTPNAGQADEDGNGIGDACQDTDDDGVIDAWDNCPDTANPAQLDTDGDGQGDACEPTQDEDPGLGQGSCEGDELDPSGTCPAGEDDAGRTSEPINATQRNVSIQEESQETPGLPLLVAFLTILGVAIGRARPL